MPGPRLVASLEPEGRFVGLLERGTARPDFTPACAQCGQTIPLVPRTRTLASHV